jgi:hypothetical protein
MRNLHIYTTGLILPQTNLQEPRHPILIGDFLKIIDIPYNPIGCLFLHPHDSARLSNVSLIFPPPVRQIIRCLKVPQADLCHFRLTPITPSRRTSHKSHLQSITTKFEKIFVLQYDISPNKYKMIPLPLLGCGEMESRSLLGLPSVI